MNLLDNGQRRTHLIDPTCERHGVKLTIDHGDVLDHDLVWLVREPEGNGTAYSGIYPHEEGNTIGVSHRIYHGKCLQVRRRTTNQTVFGSRLNHLAMSACRTPAACWRRISMTVSGVRDGKGPRE